MKHMSAIRVMGIILAITLAPIAGAAMRDGSKGDWHTGEITEKEYTTRWGYGATDQGHINVISADPEKKQVGDSSIKFYTETGFDAWTYFPNTKDLDLDCTKISSISFLLHTENKNGWGPDCWVILKDMEGRKVTYNPIKHDRIQLTLQGWVPYGLPVGLEAERPQFAAIFNWKLEIDKGFDWTHVALIELHEDTGGYGFVMYVDDLRFNARGGEPAKWWLSSMDKPDLTVTYAEQLPHYERYAVDYPNPWGILRAERQKLKRWPDEGEEVTYMVHVRNEGFADSPPTDFLCTIDGKVVSKLTVASIKAKGETIIPVTWTWKQGAYVFHARVDTQNKLDEISKKNNILEFQTDAYQLYAYVEKGCAKRVSDVNNGLGSFSFEDWLRYSTVDSMNRIFRESTYDFAPKGTRARVRIGKIIYGDKIGEGPLASKGPDAAWNEDGSWNYPEGSWIEYCNLANNFMWALNHELMHQLGVIDDYQMDLGPKGNEVNGKPHPQPDGGMMGGGRSYGRGRTHLADTDIAGLEATYGHRRGWFGEYLYNIPDNNTVTFTVENRPVANTEVLVYQIKWDKGMGRDETGNGTIVDKTVMAGTTDSGGRYVLKNRPVLHEFTTATGCTLKPNPFGHIDVVGRNGVLMFRLKIDGKWHYEFMDIGLFNVEYARGNKKEAFHKVKLKLEDEENGQEK